MLIVLFLLVVVVTLFVAAVVATRDGDVLVDVAPDAADLALPAGPVQPEDVAELRFGMAVRGYRMSEVDAVLARLAGELAARDARLAELEQALVDVVEPEVARLEQQQTTDLIAPEPEAVHAPVVDVSGPDDFGFPEVAEPEAAPEGMADATDLERTAASPELLEVPPDPVDAWLAPPEPAVEPAVEPAREPEPQAVPHPAVPEPVAAEPELAPDPVVEQPVAEEPPAAESAESAEVAAQAPWGPPGEGAVQEADAVPAHPADAAPAEEAPAPGGDQTARPSD